MRPLLRASALALLAAGAACGGSAAHTGPAEGPRRAGAARQGAAEGRPYADTPLTPLARELTRLATAAVEGRRLPRTRLPLRGELEPVRWSGDAAAPLEPVAFVARLDVALGEPAAGWARVGLLLTDGGVHVFELWQRPLPADAPRAPLSELGPRLPSLVAGAIEAARAGALGDLALDARAASALLGERLVAELSALGVTPPAAPGAPSGGRLVGAAVVARGAGGLYLLDLGPATADDGGFGLRAGPLVEAAAL